MTTCRCGMRPAAATSTPPPASCCPTWDEALDAISPVDDQPLHVVRFGAKFDAQGVLAGSKDATRCIGYLTKYLTKQLGDCHHPDTDAQREHVERLADALRYEPCSPTCANWLRYGVQPKNPRPGLVPGACKGKAHRYDHLGLRRAAGAGLPQVVRQDAGRPPRRPPGLADRDARSFGNRPHRLPVGAGPARRRGLPAARQTAAAALSGIGSAGKTPSARPDGEHEMPVGY